MIINPKKVKVGYTTEEEAGDKFSGAEGVGFTPEFECALVLELDCRVELILELDW